MNEDNMTAGIPKVSQQSFSSKNTGLGHSLGNPMVLAVLAVVSGLLLPPLGVILAIATIYKAGQTGRRLLLVLGIISVLAVMSGTFGYIKLYNDRQNNRTYSYTYTNLSDFKVSMGQGLSISFKLPTELLPKKPTSSQQANSDKIPAQLQIKDLDPSKEANTNQMIFSHPQNSKTGSPLILAKEGVFINPTNANNLRTALKTTGSDEYKKLTADLQKLLQTQTGAQKITLNGSPKGFTNANIKGDAWQFDFTAEGANPLATNPKNKKYQGAAVVALGNKGGYYELSFSILDYNWQSNQKILQAILGSIKVDQ